MPTAKPRPAAKISDRTNTIESGNAPYPNFSAIHILISDCRVTPSRPASRSRSRTILRPVGCAFIAHHTTPVKVRNECAPYASHLLRASTTCMLIE
jgi:hypothetical protein